MTDTLRRCPASPPLPAARAEPLGGSRGGSHRAVHGRPRRLRSQRRGPLDPCQPAHLRRRPATRYRGLRDHLRGAPGHRRQARRHPGPPAPVPVRPGHVHPGLARLRPGRLDRRARHAALHPGRRGGGDDPAGPQPDPADLHRRRPGPPDAPLRGGAGRRRGDRAGRRRRAGQREHPRQHLATGIFAERSDRGDLVPGRAADPAERPWRAGPHPGPGRAGHADPGRAGPDPAPGARPVRALARLGLGLPGWQRRAVRPVRRGGAPGRRPWWLAADPRPAAAAARDGGRDRGAVLRDGRIRRVLLRAGPAPAGRPGLLADAGRPRRSPPPGWRSPWSA